MNTRRERYGVAVVGGGSAGVAAAVAAARLGVPTVLVERYGFLGGAATQSIVLTYDGFLYRRVRAEWAVGGIGRELIASLVDFGSPAVPTLSPNGNWMLPFAPEASKAALDRLVRQAGAKCRLECRLHALLTGVHRGAGGGAGRIEALVVRDHLGEFEIEAEAFVDASGEADLAALAGVPILHDTGPRFAASLCARLGGIRPGTLRDREVLKRVMAALPPAFGVAQLRQSGGFILDIPGSDDIWWMGIDAPTDGLSSPSLTRAEQDSRAAAHAFVQRLRQEPGCERATLVATGPQLGIRETRHPQARVMLSEADALAGRRSPTTIARAAWNIERHDQPGRPTVASIGGEGFFDIPLDALCAEGPDNLWLAGRTVGADRGAYASLRVMGTAFATGHAAGVAAALATRGPCVYEDVRAALVAQGAIL
ncbi:MAG: hypothetical protein RIQ60_2408 [Pseudomonadota bacterium]|jgi:hypothetical protein